MATVIEQRKSKPVTSEVSLIPQSKFDEITRLDRILRESRLQIQQASPMAKAFITAAAMKELENAITDGMMSDIMNLMDSPLGFKTDRRPGATRRIKKGDKWIEEKVEPYNKLTIKRCVIVALLAGAQLSGNEFNILVGQTYFTKEFMQRAVLAFPGINNFRMEIGNPMKLGDKTAAMDARATWNIGKDPFSLECRKSESGDMRIVVNAYETSGVDQLRGLAESKLLRRVFQALTGIKSYDPEDGAGESNDVEGKLASPIQLEHSTDQQPTNQLAIETTKISEEVQTSEYGGFVYNFPDAEQVFFFIDSCCEKIAGCESVESSARMVEHCLKDMQQLDFTANANEFIQKQLEDRNATAFACYRGMKKAK